jgi:glycine cleavage system aminomethyltransferase T
MLPDTGGVRWLRLTPTHAGILCADLQTAGHPSIPNELLERLNARTPERPNACLHATDLSSALTTLAVIGPRSSDLLARLARLDLDPRAFADHSVAQTGAAGIPLQILRWDRGPLLTYELTVGRDVAEYWGETLMHAGSGLGLQPVGVETIARLDGQDKQPNA